MSLQVKISSPGLVPSAVLKAKAVPTTGLKEKSKTRKWFTSTCRNQRGNSIGVCLVRSRLSRGYITRGCNKISCFKLHRDGLRACVLRHDSNLDILPEMNSE